MTDSHDLYDAAAASGAYALDALTGAEKDAFERSLATSEGLRDEVDGFRATAAELGLAAPAVEPPAALRADLLARIASLPQEDSAERANARVDGADRGQAASETAAPAVAPPAVASLVGRRTTRDARTRGIRRAGSSGLRPLTALVAAAAAVVLFLGGILLGGVLDAVSDSRSTDTFAALNAAADAERSEIALPNGGRAEVVASEQLGYSAVVMHDAPALPADQAFQLWYVNAEEGPVSAGVMPPLQDGYFVLAGEYSGGETVAMTIEPAGGSSAPTTDPMILLS